MSSGLESESDNARDELGYCVSEWHVALVPSKSLNDVNSPDTPFRLGQQGKIPTRSIAPATGSEKATAGSRVSKLSGRLQTTGPAATQSLGERR